jgi:hypothetical protein
VQGISRGQEVDKKTGWHAGVWTGKQVSNTAGKKAGHAYIQEIRQWQEVDKNTGWHAGIRTGKQVNSRHRSRTGIYAVIYGVSRGNK